MLRVVLDTSVLVAGLRSRQGASNALLVLVAEQNLKPLTTTSLFLEYEEVLLRAEQRLATGMSEADVAGFLAAFASASEGVEVHFQWRPQLGDPADEMVLEAAINGYADALVTHNVADFAAAARKFGLRVATPGELLRELKT
jgi:putative PIN family toxin of toxin-antitoxin system